MSSPSASPTPAEIETSRLQSKLFAYSAQLKSLHRKSIMSVRATKQLTSDARSEIDRLNLQLQNLVYEQRHLRGEIRGCEEYEYVFSAFNFTSPVYMPQSPFNSRSSTKLTNYSSHKYTSLPLISIEDYLELFPDHASLSEHDLMIARIAHEHVKRQALEEKRQGLLKRKQGLIAENNRRKEDLANLDKDLERFIEAADPIIKTFEKDY
jgi:THO complex subunit 5